MRAHILGAVCGVSLLLSASRLIAQDTTNGPDSVRGDSASSALDLVQQALRAELEGDSARRAAWLAEALRVEPDCAPARWQSGFVRVDDRWLSLTEAQSKFSADPRLTEYRQVRESVEDSPQKELLLARWCQDKQCSDQARFHWLNVLRVQPGNAEALRTLGVQWYNGLLLTPEQVDQQKRQDFKASRSATQKSARRRRCESMITLWEAAADRGDSSLLDTMEADLAAQTSPGATVMINNLICQRSQNPRDPEAFQIVSQNWVRLLAQDPSLTRLVVMHAVGHPMEAVRITAADELKKQPREKYVPLLLACARFPVEFACSVLQYGGSATARYTLDFQGLEADSQIEHTDFLNIAADFFGPAMMRQRQSGEVLAPDPSAEDPARAVYPAWFAAAAVGRARDVQSFVDQYNTAAVQINERVTAALAHATAQQNEADPRAWQKWWMEYLADEYELGAPPRGNDRGSQGEAGTGSESYARDDTHYPLPKDRPLYRHNSSSSDFAFSPPRPRFSTSCFAASTLVWTSTGPRPIESLRPGDSVLSQNVSSGQLEYKLVELVTKTDPAPMMKVTVGGSDIVSTLGHPFWVVGKGWTMTKQLEVGSLLHTVSGPLPVEKLEQIPAAKEWYEVAYNLQIADFHTYFVGEQRVLVHHLTMLSILDEGSAQVPGL